MADEYEFIQRRAATCKLGNRSEGSRSLGLGIPSCRLRRRRILKRSRGAQCENVPANNPKGIETSSPRLASNAYLGCAFGNGNNAKGVVAEVGSAGGNGWAATTLRLAGWEGL